ncbi:hypothetical protein BpHYR1_024542 [Brachionus plicatilis]|uniref:Uncharacterized protein n=1 Tax=Brachionus plicatilis TaxID=10195 RepID=A0A3M7RYI7_BRAPC|nr:hypothetical protein BpHYR1_024542 [Brachionus plicatilis]
MAYEQLAKELYNVYICELLYISSLKLFNILSKHNLFLKLSPTKCVSQVNNHHSRCTLMVMLLEVGSFNASSKEILKLKISATLIKSCKSIASCCISASNR